jgi:hypothetical protein
MLEIIERPLTSDEYFQLQTRLQTARDESGNPSRVGTVLGTLDARFFTRARKLLMSFLRHG